MRSSMCLSMTGRLAIAVLGVATISWAQNRPPIAERMAKAYGLDSFGQVEAVRYTFNLNIPAAKLKLSQTWEWEPKSGQVTYDDKGKDGKVEKVTYKRSQLSNQPDAVKNTVDPAFINDQYWLVFPFHVIWDSSADVRDMGMHKLPLGKGSAELLVVKYPAEGGGYTPGDTWDLYLGKDCRVEQMVYHRGGPKKPSLVTVTWTGYKKAGPLLVSTEHHGTADGTPLSLSFSDVSVKLAGSSTWLTAK